MSAKPKQREKKEYYFDNISIVDDNSKSSMNRYLNNNWNDYFQSRHKIAKNKYFASNSYNNDSKSDDYTKLDKNKDYSDFPYLFDFIKNEYKLTLK